MAYEKRLLHSTKGVNTQRGILFSAGVLCGVAGFASRLGKILSPETILQLVKEMTRGLVAQELGSLPRDKSDMTAGEQLYLQHGTTGIRGEVEAGFPSVTKIGLPAFRYALSRAKTLNESLIHSLLTLMTVTEDSTIIWRKGMAQLLEVHSSAREILEKGSIFTIAGRRAIRYLDQELKLKGISPGASADLLAVTVGLYLLENGQFPAMLL
jgi:triphosphoribosyl-dephospho-CoA synthase